MKRIALIWMTALVTIAALCGSATQAEDETVGIYFAKYVPVAELGDSVQAFLADAPNAAETRVVVQVVTNSLLLRGKPEVVQRVHEMLKQLDRKPATVFVEVVIVNVTSAEEPARVAITEGSSADEIVAALAKQGELQVLARVQLSAVSNQAAYIQIGQGKPHVTGVQESARGVIRSVARENVGMTMGLTPRVTPEGTVMIEVDVERSDLTDTGIELASAGEQAAGVTSLNLQTTVCAKSGQTVILGGRTEGSNGKWQKLLAVLTPTIIE